MYSMYFRINCCLLFGCWGSGDNLQSISDNLDSKRKWDEQKTVRNWVGEEKKQSTQGCSACEKQLERRGGLRGKWKPFQCCARAEGVCLCVQTCCLYLSCGSPGAYRVCMCAWGCVCVGVYMLYAGMRVCVCVCACLLGEKGLICSRVRWCVWGKRSVCLFVFADG